MQAPVNVRLCPGDRLVPGVLTNRGYAGALVVVCHGVAYSRELVDTVYVDQRCPGALFDEALDHGWPVLGKPALSIACAILSTLPPSRFRTTDWSGGSTPPNAGPYYITSGTLSSGPGLCPPSLDCITIRGIV